MSTQLPKAINLCASFCGRGCYIHPLSLSCWKHQKYLDVILWRSHLYFPIFLNPPLLCTTPYLLLESRRSYSYRTAAPLLQLLCLLHPGMLLHRYHHLGIQLLLHSWLLCWPCPSIFTSISLSLSLSLSLIFSLSAVGYATLNSSELLE